MIHRICIAVLTLFTWQAAAQSDVLKLESTPYCNVADLLPDDVIVAGSSQGMAIYGDTAFLMHDKGQCVIINLKDKRFINTFLIEGNDGHCNNASFGRERYSSPSPFPLLYVSECRGERACYVNDITTEGARLVQKIFYDGEDITGPSDWVVDARRGDIYLYCTIDGRRSLKRFKLPRLSHSDADGEVHLTQQDTRAEIYLGEVAIPQGSFIRGRYIYLPDGVPSRERKLHVVDIRRNRLVGVADLNHIEYEPEGIAAHGDQLYISFHTPRSPRDNRIYRIEIDLPQR